VRRAVELGINYVDTAPMYGDSEQVLGRILPEIDAPLIVSTKLGARPQPFDPKEAAALRASFEESCRLLGREQIDILMIHEPDRPRQGRPEAEEADPAGAVRVEALEGGGDVRDGGGRRPRFPAPTTEPPRSGACGAPDRASDIR